MYQYQRFWNWIAQSYANNPIKDQIAYNNMVEKIRNHVKESDTVLDFGCGTGTYSIAIADKAKSIHAIDISEKMLAIAEERASNRGINNIHFEHHGIFESQLQPSSYNAILAFNILHLQQDVDKVLERIKELLAPGGKLICKTVCVSSKFTLIPFLLKPFSKIGLLPHFNCFSFTQLQQAISHHQMNILETGQNYEGSIEYFLVAKVNSQN